MLLFFHVNRRTIRLESISLIRHREAVKRLAERLRWKGHLLSARQGLLDAKQKEECM